MKKLISVMLCLMLAIWPLSALGETLTGEADGFGGKIIAEVTVEDGKIVDLKLTGDGETPDVGGAALEPLTEAILAAGTIDGVDAYSGASWTSAGVFAAIRAALGIEEEAEAEAEAVTASASGLKQGLGIVATPRLGPGKDDQEVPVYSLNVVVAYAITDAEDRIVDLDVDILEMITPNHDGADDNALAGWPGESYNADMDGDGVVEGPFDQTEENFVSDLPGWNTKRMLGDAYKLNSGTWAQEMDLFQSAFRGKTADELDAWADKFLSEVNGRPLHGTSENEADIAKWDALTDEEKAEMDAISGATISLTDAHGDIIAAVKKAVANAVAVPEGNDVASLGLGVKVTPRLGPGKDDQEVPVYSINVVAAGAIFDTEGKVNAAREDILEIITPNHDGANDSQFTGWPEQSYNADEDGDGTVEAALEQTEDSFIEQVNAFRTKRELDTLYKINSGTWAQEMDTFESVFVGKTSEDLDAWAGKFLSEVNGRPLHGTSENEADIAKWDALTDEEKAEMDAISGATISLTDAHGDLLGALQQAWTNARPSNITVE